MKTPKLRFFLKAILAVRDDCRYLGFRAGCALQPVVVRNAHAIQKSNTQTRGYSVARRHKVWTP